MGLEKCERCVRLTLLHICFLEQIRHSRKQRSQMTGEDSLGTGSK